MLVKHKNAVFLPGKQETTLCLIFFANQYFPGDFYINNTFNSAVEVIGDTAIAFAVIFGRKKVMCVALMGAGIFCISSMLTKLNADGIQGRQS